MHYFNFRNRLAARKLIPAIHPNNSGTALGSGILTADTAAVNGFCHNTARQTTGSRKSTYRLSIAVCYNDERTINKYQSQFGRTGTLGSVSSRGNMRIIVLCFQTVLQLARWGAHRML